MANPDPLITNWIIPIVINLISAGIGAIAMFFIRRKYARKIMKFEKWNINDIITLELLAVRNYPFVEIKEIDIAVFHHIRSRIEDVKFIQDTADGMVIQMPLFGNLVIEIEKFSYEDRYEEHQKNDGVKLSIKTEIPVRLGARELEKLHDFEKNTNIIFDIIENKVFVEGKIPKDNFAICDVLRTKYLVENKHFELVDNELNVRVQGEDSQITITSPIDKLTKAAEKYYFS